MERYVANSQTSTITKHEIVRETAMFVVLEANGQQWKEPKDGNGISWHTTYKEASENLINSSINHIDFLQDCLKKEYDKLIIIARL